MSAAAREAVPATAAGPACGRLATLFDGLDALLAAHAPQWLPAPYREPASGSAPAVDARLRARLDALEDAELEALENDDDRLRAWLSPSLPHLDGLHVLLAGAGLQADPPPDPAPDLPPGPRSPPGRDPQGGHGRDADWSVPGRKAAQVAHFARAIGPLRGARFVEWCAGKGHLGRRLCLDGAEVLSIERDAALVDAGRALAARAGARQTWEVADVHAPATPGRLRDTHLVALHACGALHRRAIAVALRGDGPTALDLAPCCLHLGLCRDGWRAGRPARLQPSADTLRLAVTGTATAGLGERLRQQRQRLAIATFAALRARVDGRPGAPMPPVPAAWLGETPRLLCERLAARAGLALPRGLDWDAVLAEGRERHARVRRHTLVRHAHRRALEVWYLADLGLRLRRQGWEVRLAPFCPRALTPRNLWLQARRGQPSSR